MANKKRSVKIDWFGDELLATVREHKEPALWAAGQILKREAVRRTPRASNTLARSAYVETDERMDHVKGPRDRRRLFRKRGQGGALIAFAAFYGNFYEDSGAKSHTIKPRRRKALLIPGVGYRMRVQHTGVRARPFLGPALDAMRETIVDAILAELGGAIEQELPE